MPLNVMLISSSGSPSEKNRKFEQLECRRADAWTYCLLLRDTKRRSHQASRLLTAIGLNGICAVTVRVSACNKMQLVTDLNALIMY